jgi:hypothetical protein
MASGDLESGRFTEAQREQIERRPVDQDRTLLAMHELEAALGSAAPARETRWREVVLGALTVLGDATREEAKNAEQPDSLLSDVAFNQPRLRNRVRGYGRNIASCIRASTRCAASSRNQMMRWWTSRTSGNGSRGC